MELIIAFVALVVIGYFWYYNRKNIKFDEPVVPAANIDAAEKNIKETTEPVVAKVAPAPFVAPVVEPVLAPVVEPAPAAVVDDKPWTEKQPAGVAKKPAKKQTAKTTAPKKKKPAGK